jgi:hypothetical protein
MEPDDFSLRLEELDRSCVELEERLDGLRQALVEIRRLRRERRPLSEIVAFGPGLPARRDVRGSVSRLNAALHAYRVQAIRTIVDDEGLSIAQTARVTGNARQVVSRLYHDEDGPGPGA